MKLDRCICTVDPLELYDGGGSFYARRSKSVNQKGAAGRTGTDITSSKASFSLDCIAVGDCSGRIMVEVRNKTEWHPVFGDHQVSCIEDCGTVHCTATSAPAKIRSPAGTTWMLTATTTTKTQLYRITRRWYSISVAQQRRKHPNRGGQNLSERYARLENSVRGKESQTSKLDDLKAREAEPIGLLNRRLVKKETLFHGLVIPEEPISPKDDGASLPHISTSWCSFPSQNAACPDAQSVYMTCTKNLWRRTRQLSAKYTRPS